MQSDQGSRAVPSRRVFLRAGAGALLIGPEELAARVASLSISLQPGALRARSQYLSEASLFESATNDLAAAARLAVDTDAARSRFTSQVTTAGSKLDLTHSWMVGQCLADANLERWVRATVRDDASLRSLVAALNRNPKALDHVAEVAALRTRLHALKATKLAIVQQVIAKERAIAGVEAGGAAAAAKAAAAAECEATWAIVTAILATVVVVVVAIVATATSAANTLSATYKGTGADLAQGVFLASNRRYQQCLSAAESLPPVPRARAIAACQARWLEETSASLV